MRRRGSRLAAVKALARLCDEVCIRRGSSTKYDGECPARMSRPGECIGSSIKASTLPIGIVVFKDEVRSFQSHFYRSVSLTASRHFYALAFFTSFRIIFQLFDQFLV
jgi:hypothetical protein